jgi:biotin carboxyl carrier protein
VKRTRTLRGGNGDAHRVEIEAIEDGFRLNLGEDQGEATAVRGNGAGIWSILLEGGRSLEALVERGESGIEVTIGSARFQFATASGGAARSATAASGRIEVRSPMPGKIVKLLVSRGESLSAGQPVLLFEAMKMQNELRAPQSGTLLELDVREGQPVEARERLYVLGPASQ